MQDFIREQKQSIFKLKNFVLGGNKFHTKLIPGRRQKCSLYADIPQYFSFLVSEDLILPGKLTFKNRTKSTILTIHASYTKT